MLEHLISNIHNAPVRRETLKGRPHLVVPVVMMTEGVHNGSHGPLYYPPEEFERASPAWNLKPIVVYHPTINGAGCSACDPDILEAQQVGVVMNVRWNGKQRAEAWIDEEDANRVDSRIVDAIVAGKVMEVSTGLFTENEAAEGEWNGEAYIGIARNHQPDHLALLPDKVGACSIADGAGLLQLNEASEIDATAIQRHYMADVRAHVANMMSHDEVHMQVSKELHARHGGGDVEQVWVAAMYDGFAIYHHGEKLWKVAYTTGSDDMVVVADEPVEVRRVTEYRTVEGGAFVANFDPAINSKNDEDTRIKEPPPGKTRVTRTRNQGKIKMKTREEFIAHLIANTDFTEPMLASLSDTTIQNMASDSGADVDPVEPETPVVENTETETTAPAPAPTVDDYINQAPEGMRDVLRNGVAAHAAEKAGLIKTITANAKNPFSAEFLGTKGVDELRGMAALAAPADTPAPTNNGAVPMFNGAATPHAPNAAQGTPVNNEDEALPVPTLSWD